MFLPRLKNYCFEYKSLNLYVFTTDFKKVTSESVDTNCHFSHWGVSLGGFAEGSVADERGGVGCTHGEAHAEGTGGASASRVACEVAMGTRGPSRVGDSAFHTCVET